MDTALPKIAQLVADARIELKLLGIDTEGKRSDELLKWRANSETTPAWPDPKPNEHMLRVFNKDDEPECLLWHCQTNLSGPAKGYWSEAFRPRADATRLGRQNGSV